MAKKLILSRLRAMKAALHRVDNVVPSYSGIRAESETNNELPFRILDETSKDFPKFNTTGRSLLIKFNSPNEEQEPMSYLKECITALTDWLVREVPDRDMVGLCIRNTKNLQDKAIGVSLRRRDQLKPEVVWSVLGKIVQSNATFALTDRLKVRLDHVRMPVGNGREKTKGRFIDVLSAVKKSIVVVKASVLCLTHALVIAIAWVNNNPKYKSYRNGRGLKEPVQDLLKASGVDLSNGGVWNNFDSFSSSFRTTKLLCLMD
jgi:hypothetical protein